MNGACTVIICSSYPSCVSAQLDIKRVWELQIQHRNTFSDAI